MNPRTTFFGSAGWFGKLWFPDVTTIIAGYGSINSTVEGVTRVIKDGYYTVRQQIIFINITEE